jgi:phosphoglycerol transferase
MSFNARSPQHGQNATINIVACLIAILVSVIVCRYGVGLTYGRGDVPFLYEGDSLQYSYVLEAQKAGSVAHIDLAGAPIGTDHLDFPNADYANHVMANAVAAPGDFGERYNRVYLLGVALTALAGFAVARRLGIGLALSVAVSIAFSVLPFHFMREAHLYYNNYSALALSLLVATWTYLPPSPGAAPRTRSQRWQSIAARTAILIWIGATGIYFAFFTCVLLGAAGVLSFLQFRSTAGLRRMTLSIAVIVCCTSLQLLPTVLYRMENGRNDQVAARVMSETEIYGLKIAQMLLPVPEHRFDLFARLRQKYDVLAPLNTENSTAGLGLVGALGFCLALLILLVPAFRSRLPQQAQFAAMTVAIMTVFATIGGFAALFSLIVSPEIRSVNRVSPLIGFASLIVLASVMQTLAAAYNRRWLPPLAAALMVLIAIPDQVPDRRRMLKERTAAAAVRFDSDRKFVADLRRHVPAGANVLQLPFLEYPETNSPLGHYTQLRNQLHGLDLHWTYGAMKGRAASNWLSMLTTRPAEEAVRLFDAAGYSAVVVDERDRTPWIEDFMRVLSAAHPLTTIVSDDRSQTGYALKTPPVVRPALLLAPGSGWYSPEDQGGGKLMMWSSGDAALRIAPVAGGRAGCSLGLSLGTVVPRHVDVLLDGVRVAQAELSPQTRIQLAIAIPKPGALVQIQTSPDAAPPGNGDSRTLAFSQLFDGPLLCGGAAQ